MTRQLSASSVANALRCGFAYRDGVETVAQPVGKAAEFGTLVHAAVEHELQGTSRRGPYSFDDPEEVDPNVHRHVAQVMKWLNSAHGLPTPMPTKVESGLIYNTRTDTAEWGPGRGDFGDHDGSVYGTTPPGCIRGTLDMLWIDDGVAHVVDLKTGKVKDYRAQLRTLGLAVARILGVTTVRVGALYSRLTKVIEPKWEVMDEDALDLHAGILHRLLRRLPMAEQNAGDQCVYCEATTRACAFKSRPIDDYETAYDIEGDAA